MIENLTHPGIDPVGGDQIKITHPSGAIEIKQYMTPTPDPAPVVILPPLTPRQIRLALVSVDITDASVETLIGELPDADTALINWRFANSYDRSHPLVEAMISAFELNPSEVDDLWAWASGL